MLPSLDDSHILYMHMFPGKQQGAVVDCQFAGSHAKHNAMHIMLQTKCLLYCYLDG